MINKNLVHERFSKSLDSYHEHARVQKRMAQQLFSLIKNKNPKKILEIGCGTGFLTEIAKSNLDFEEYIAIDIVENCESYVKKINPCIKFITADIENFIKENSEEFDLIISNASLQWVDNFEQVVTTLKNKLSLTGELVFSTFGKENFREIYHILGASLNYYSIIELQNMFPNSLIEPEIHIMAFENPKEVLRHLQMTGVNAIEKISWTKSDLIKFENAYKNICSMRPTLTYNPIYIKITKNDTT